MDVIVLNFNGLAYLKGCLASLYKNTTYPFHAIIVDNASSDGSREWLESFAEKTENVTLHFNEKPDEGYANGTNIGLQYCKSKYTLLLNNDVLIMEKNWLWALNAELDADSEVGIVGCKLVYPNNLIQHAGVTFAYNPITRLMVPFHIGRFSRRDTPSFCIRREVPCVTGACLLTRRELLKDGLDEVYKVGGYEDVDYCCKIRKAGFKIMYVPVELFHYEGATNLTRPPTFGEQLTKNYMVWAKRYSDWLKKEFESNTSLYDVRGKILVFR